MAKSDQLENMLLRTIPAQRWFVISRQMDMPADEIMQSMLAMLVVAANERQRQAAAAAGQRVTDDLGRFLAMPFLDLVEASGVNEIDDDGEAAESGPKSGEPGGDVLEDPGAVVPGDGPDA